MEVCISAHEQTKLKAKGKDEIEEIRSFRRVEAILPKKAKKTE